MKDSIKFYSESKINKSCKEFNQRIIFLTKYFKINNAQKCYFITNAHKVLR